MLWVNSALKYVKIITILRLPKIFRVRNNEGWKIIFLFMYGILREEGWTLTQKIGCYATYFWSDTVGVPFSLFWRLLLTWWWPLCAIVCAWKFLFSHRNWSDKQEIFTWNDEPNCKLSVTSFVTHSFAEIIESW